MRKIFTTAMYFKYYNFIIIAGHSNVIKLLGKRLHKQYNSY